MAVESNSCLTTQEEQEEELKPSFIYKQEIQ